MSALDELAWWAFEMSLPDGRTSGTNYVPAVSEVKARAKMRETHDPAYRDRVALYPLISTRVCSREALTRSLLRRTAESNCPAGTTNGESK